MSTDGARGETSPDSPPRAGRAILAIVICALTVPLAAGCGSSGEDPRDEALASLRLTTEAASLQSEMGKLVGGLSSDPSAAERRLAQRQLASLDREAVRLIASAAADSTYEVELLPLNGSRAIGVATLVEGEGKVAIKGDFKGVAAGGDHGVAIHALGPGQGRSVCPPRNAAVGSDRTLSATEAEDFYGRPAVRLGSVPGGAPEASLSASRPAGGSPPLDVRVLVLSGGVYQSYRGDAPVACGVPTIARGVAAATASTELVTAVNQTRAAGVELSAVVRNPTSGRAAVASHRAVGRLDAATSHLRTANKIAIEQLEENGGVTAEVRQTVTRADAALGGSQAVVRGGFRTLRESVARERSEKRRRLAQRRAGQEAAREAQEEAAPVPELPPEPEPEPEHAPEYAPEPAPEPTPSAPEGPTIPHPG